MDQSEEEPIVCRNFCMQDPDTGYCMTCGRAPVPVEPTDLCAPKTFAGISLTSFQLTPVGGKKGDEG